MQTISIAEKLALFSDHWSPKVVADLNGQQVKLVKFQGAFDFHHHENEDEMFLVLRGSFRMEYRNCGDGASVAARPIRSQTVREGEFIVVPRGQEHRPVADQECAVMLFEPSSTLNTGNVVTEKTKPQLERI